ncbi:hypothetical protein B566_EDAN013444, partial [Ephemera danica]
MPHGVCVPCIKKLNACRQLLQVSKSSYRKLKATRDAYKAQNTITIYGLIETSQYDTFPSPVSNVPSPVGSEQEIFFELDADVMLEDFPSVPLESTAVIVADVTAVEGACISLVEATTESVVEATDEKTEEEIIEPEPVEMEEYSALLPLAKGSQLTFIYLETNAYTTIARLHVIIININEAVLADHDKLQETITRITVDMKR